jgi:hypothetical protein
VKSAEVSNVISDREVLDADGNFTVVGLVNVVELADESQRSLVE